MSRQPPPVAQLIHTRTTGCLLPISIGHDMLCESCFSIPLSSLWTQEYFSDFVWYWIVPYSLHICASEYPSVERIFCFHPVFNLSPVRLSSIYYHTRVLILHNSSALFSLFVSSVKRLSSTHCQTGGLTFPVIINRFPGFILFLIKQILFEIPNCWIFFWLALSHAFSSSIELSHVGQKATISVHPLKIKLSALVFDPPDVPEYLPNRVIISWKQTRFVFLR